MVRSIEKIYIGNNHNLQDKFEDGNEVLASEFESWIWKIYELSWK
jgi:hypothetical protein